MRKHTRNTQVAANLFLMLIACVAVRAQPALNGYSAGVLNYNPLGYWPLTETVAPPVTSPVATNLGSLGSTANGQYLGGSYVGQAGALPGSTDTSVAFERSTGEVVVPYSSGLTQSGALGISGAAASFTAECWLNPTFTNGTTEWILGYGNFGNPAGNPTAGYSGFGLFMSGARLNAVLYDTNTTTASVTLTTSSAATNLLLQSNWYHVAVVFSNNAVAHTTNLFIFTNGVLAASQALTTANTAGLTFVSDDGTGQPGTSIGTTFAVGCQPNQANFFQGNIGEAALYPSALTPAVLLSHYQNGTNTAPSQSYSSLVLASTPLIYLPLNEKGAGYTYPVATNYAASGSAGNGYYLQGTSPGGATGPAALGTPSAVTFPPSTQRTAYQLAETGRSLTVGANVEMAPLNDLLLNINTNFLAGTANSNTTVVGWVKVPTSSVASPTGIPWLQEIMGRNDGSSWRLDVTSTFFPNTNGLPGYPDFANGGLDNVSPIQVNDGVWHFWAATYNQTNFLNTIYIDGVLQSQVQVTGLPSYANTSPMTVGSGANTSDNARNFANGSVCGVAVYNAALSLAQIDAIFGSAYGGIISQPPATVNYAAGTVTISAVVEGSFIQWYTGNPSGAKTAVTTGTSGEISGANTESLTLNPPAAGDFTNYFVIVGNGTTLANSTLTATSAVVALNKLAITGSFVSAVQALNPVGFWPLNEASGTVAYNWGSLGSMANGVYVTDPNGSSTVTQLGVSGPGYASLPTTQALQFGTGHGTDILGGAGVFINSQVGLELSGSNNITGTPNPVTLAHWVQIPTGAVPWFQSIVGKGDDSYRTDEEQPRAGWNAHTSGDLQSGTNLASFSGLNDGTWHFWVCTWDGISQQNIYIDGQIAGTSTVTPSTGGNSHQLFIGGAPDYVGRNFVGNVADVIVFNYALSASQALQLWNTMYNTNVSLPQTAYYISGTATATIVAQAQGPYLQWYFGTPGGSATAVFNNANISGAGTTLGSGSPTLTFTASGSPPAIPVGDFGTYFLVVGNGSGSFVTSSIVTLSQTSLPNGTYDQAVLSYNPLAYWLLNETNGTIAYNYATNGLVSGSALNGVIEEYPEAPNLLNLPGPVAFGFGGANGAIGFGTSDGINYVGTENALAAARSGNGVIMTNAILNQTTNHSLAAWAQIPLGLNLGNQGYIYGERRGYGIQLGQSGGNIFAEDDNNTSTTAVTGTGLNLIDGQWHLWVQTYNATNKLVTDYIDGTPYLSFTEGAAVVTTTPTGIGSDYPGGTTRNWNGQISRVAEFTNTLTAAQVAALYNAAGVPPTFTANYAVNVAANPPAKVFATAGGLAMIGNVASTGSGPLTNTWYHGTPGSGTLITTGGRFTATSSNLVINPVLGSDAGSYYVTAANSVATTNSTVSVLTVNTNVTDLIYAGQNPTFSAAPGAASYQWSSNGVAIAGATNSTFTLTNVTVAGSPVTVVALINGATSSATNTVNVLAAPSAAYPVAVLADHPIAFYRLDEPDNGTGNTGTLAHDYINGYNGVYQNDGTPSDLVLGIAGIPYGLSLASNTDTAVSFGVLGTGAVNNTPAGPSNNFVGYIPTIDFSGTVSNSASYAPAEFSVEAWVDAQEGQANGGIVTKGFGLGDGTATAGFFEQFSLQISDVGSTGSRYDFCVHDALGNLASAQTGSFYTGFQNPPGTVFTTGTQFWQHLVGVCDQSNGVISLYVNGLLAATGSIGKTNGIMSTPVPVSIGAKQHANSSGTYDGQLQGYVDEVAIYNVALSSNQVQNHYFAAGIPPIVSLQPTNAPGIGGSGVTNAPQGSTVTLKALGYGSPGLTYKWYDYNNGGTPIAVSTAAEPGSSGANGPILTLVNVSSSAPNTIGTGTFFVTVSNPYGATNSANVTVIPVAGPPVILTDLPGTTYALAGSAVVFPLVVSGTSPQTNAWYYNNGTTKVKLANGGRYTLATGTSPSLTIANVTAADQGTYQLFITNAQSFPSATASTASVLVVNNELNFFGNGNGWTLNAAAGDTLFGSISANVLQLTTVGGGQANSFFFNTPFYVGAFQASFVYQNVTALNPNPADGFTFCLQNDPNGPAALGAAGGGLGYRGITNSVAEAFNIYNGYALGYTFSTNGVHNDGNNPAGYLPAYISTAPVSFRGGDPIAVTITYDGNTISLFAQDQSTSATFVNSLVVGAVSQWLGTNRAYVGFTGATGGASATQTISAFAYAPLPFLTAAASGNNVVVTWPTGIGGYVLQSSLNVYGPWATVTSGITVVNGNNQLSVPNTQAASTFYRLQLTPP